MSMLFKDHIQEDVLRNLETSSLVQIFDELNTYKKVSMQKYFRFFNSGLISDKVWIVKMLKEYSYDLSKDLPFASLQQLLLNVTQVSSLIGSKKGLELFLSVISLGEVSVIDYSFITDLNVLFLDSSAYGYLSSDNTNKDFFLISDSDQLKEETPTLNITIKTPFKDTEYEPVILQTISDYLDAFLPFNQGYTSNITLESRDEFFYHELLNKYFI